MFQNRGLGFIGAIQQSTRPIRDNVGAGIQSVRRGVRQASSGLNLMDTAKSVREGVAAQQAVPGGAAQQLAPGRMFSFQTRQFVEQTAALPADPSRPVKGRIVVDTGL